MLCANARHNAQTPGIRYLALSRTTDAQGVNYPAAIPLQHAHATFAKTQIYFADAQVRGSAGGEDGVIIRCELDGTGVEIAANQNLSDPRVRPNLEHGVFLAWILAFSPFFVCFASMFVLLAMLYAECSTTRGSIRT